jgi:hypothetical protein
MRSQVEAGGLLDTVFVLHDIRVMARNLRNVTVTLDEETARWARLEAARRDTSVSKLLGELLRDRMTEGTAYASAMARYLSQAPGTHRRPGSALPSRNELHDRNGLR